MLPFPLWGDSMLWQAEAGFRFRMANGFVSPRHPDTAADPAGLEYNDPSSTWQQVFAWAKAQHATMIVLDATRSSPWRTVLAPVEHPTEIGGVLLYSLAPGGRSPCTG